MTITGDYFLLSMVFLAIFFTWWSDKRKNILVAMVSFMMWFSLGMWLFFSSSPPIALGETWADILGWAFLVLSLLPWLLQMDIEIKHEAQGKRWTKYGQPPKETGPTEYERYRDILFNRTRRR
jgi:Na+/melibiose symporter-like transporter